MSVRNLDEAVKERGMVAAEKAEQLPERTLEVVAAEIRALTAQALSTIVEIGRRMAEAKEMLPHGEFGKWIKENTGYSSSTASNFMRIFEAYADPQGSLFGASVNCQTFGNLSYTKALALLEVPAEEREEFAETHNVDEMSTRELQAAIKERDEARKQVEEAEVERRKAEESRAKMEQDMVAFANERLEGLRRELEELRAKPVEVAVEKTEDKEAVARAIAETEKRLKEELEKAKADVQKAKDALEKEKKAAADKLAKAEAAAKDAEQGRKRAVKERDEEAAEAERLRKELAVSGNETVMRFRMHFDAAQRELQEMKGCLEELRGLDQENYGKLSKAYRALLEAFGMEEKE